MRLKLNFTPNNESVPINNHHILNRYIHKCLGIPNKWHDAKSDYSISQICGGKMNQDAQTLEYKNGAFIIVTSKDEEFLTTLLKGLGKNRDLGYGMIYTGPEFITEELNNGWNNFSTLAPFYIKEYKDKKTYTFLTLEDKDFTIKVENYLIKKLTKINPNLDLSNFKVNIPNNSAHKVKKILVKNVINKANSCHISIFSNKQVADLLYTIGIGQSTGSGFGTIFLSKNKEIYKF